MKSHRKMQRILCFQKQKYYICENINHKPKTIKTTIMETKKTPGLVTATLVLGILALVFALLPLFSGWFLLLMWLRWILGIAAAVCGVIALAKKYEPKNVYIGFACTLVAWFLPSFLTEAYAKALVKTAENTAQDFGNSYNNSYSNYGGYSDYSW